MSAIHSATALGWSTIVWHIPDIFADDNIPGILLEYYICRHLEFAISVYSLSYIPAVILLFAFAMSGSESNTTVTRYVCFACEARKRPSFFNSRKGAHQHITKSSRCHGSKVKSVKIMIRPSDVIAGGAGRLGIGQCPLPQHQPPGN
jgi:hypothetical protein